MKRPHPESIDYSKRKDKRLVMTNYLRIGPFQQISGHILKGRKIYRRRLFITITALIFIIIGFYGIFRQ